MLWSSIEGMIRCAVIACALKASADDLLPPNIVLIYVEHICELTSAIEAAKNKALQINKLHSVKQFIEESVSFDRVYGEATTSSNLAAILTGTSPVNTGIVRGKILPFTSFPSIACSGGLSTNEDTIPKYLARLKYHSGYIGYWKLGLGTHGSSYPTEHGFNYWAGIVHQHSEICKRATLTEWCFLSSRSDRGCISLLRQTSFAWVMAFVLLTSLLFLKFLSARCYANLLICIFSGTFAFYILLRLFLAQKSASCVYFQNNTIYEQPYSLQNMTLRITLHSVDFIRQQSFQQPLFLLVNYLSMKPPYFHSLLKAGETFCERRMAALDEFDWSLGKIIQALKDKGQYNRTSIILTGGNGCEDETKPNQKLQSIATCQPCQCSFVESVTSYQRFGSNHYAIGKVERSVMWEDHLKVPLFIKDVFLDDQTRRRVNVAAMLTDVFDTVVHLAYSSTNASAFMHGRSLLPCIRNISVHKGKFDILSGKQVWKSIAHTADAGFSDAVQSWSSPDHGQPSINADELFAPKQSGVNIYSVGLGYPISSASLYDDHRGAPMKLGAGDTQDESSSVNETNRAETLAHEIVHGYKGHVFMYHYYDLWKPVAVTMLGRYRVVFSKLLGNGELQKLSTPLIFDLASAADGGAVLDKSILEDVWTQVTNALQEHLADRRAKNVWSSEFEMPIYPWLLPCANFPRCETDVKRDDYSSLGLMPWDLTPKEEPPG